MSQLIGVLRTIAATGSTLGRACQKARKRYLFFGERSGPSRRYERLAVLRLRNVSRITLCMMPDPSSKSGPSGTYPRRW